MVSSCLQDAALDAKAWAIVVLIVLAVRWLGGARVGHRRRTDPMDIPGEGLASSENGEEKFLR